MPDMLPAGVRGLRVTGGRGRHRERLVRGVSGWPGVQLLVRKRPGERVQRRHPHVGEPVVGLRSRTVAWVALLAWLVLAIAGIATAYRMRTWDFAVFRIAAERFLAGSELYRAADQDMPFKYPPFAAALLAVIGFGSERLAGVLWNLGSMLALLWFIRAALPQIRGGDEAESPFVFTPEGALWAGAIL